jgi:predicted small integral membrane protein
MPDFFPLFAQAGVIAIQAGWLTVAVFDNWRHANLNERGFAEVLRMDLVAANDPQAYKQISYRRIESPKTEKRLFRLLVGAETTVAGLLWLSALALLLAAIGILDAGVARSLATLAALGFVAIWGSLLVGGMWFFERIGMGAAMSGHYVLSIWGVATLIFLAVAP